MVWWWFLVGCGTEAGFAPDRVLDAVSAERMKADVDWLASEASEGRIPGSVGHDQARDHLVAALEDLGAQPLGVEGGFVHTFQHVARQGHFLPTEDGGAVQSEDTLGQNLVAVLPGADPARADEYIVLMAHYDHLGVTRDGSATFTGAFDDAAGVAALLEIGRALVEGEAKLGRSVILLLSDSEEARLQGATAWVDTPTVAPDDVLVGLSLDPLGRSLLPDYGPLLFLGAERSPALLALLREVAPRMEQPDDGRRREVRFLARDMIEGFASDQDAFLDEELPAVWANSPGMAFYHTVDDTADTIDYGILRDHTRFLAQTLFALDAHEGGFEVEDPPAWDRFALTELVRLLDGVIASSELDDAEIARAETLRGQVAPAAEAGDPSLIADPDTLRLAAVLLLFDLARAHPGPIPPPFPDDAP